MSLDLLDLTYLDLNLKVSRGHPLCFTKAKESNVASS